MDNNCSSSSQDISSSLNEKQKLLRLKGLLRGALVQIRKKLGVIENSISSLTIPKQVNNDIKVLCSILIEIRESLKHYPTDDLDSIIKIDQEHINHNSKIDEKLNKFKMNVLNMLEKIKEKLFVVEEFFENTDSLPQAMTIAISIREITMHLKVVSSRNNGKVISIPGAPKRHISRQTSDGCNVSDIVNYYSKLSHSPSLGTKEVIQITRLNKHVTRKLSSLPDTEIEIKTTEEPEKINPSISNIRMNVQAKESMEKAVMGRLQTLTKTKGKQMQNLLQAQTLTTLFDDKIEKGNRKITRLLNSGQEFYSGNLNKKTNSLFTRGSKSYFWVLDTEKLSYYQSEHSSIPVKAYILSNIKSCSWEDNINEISKNNKLNEVIFTIKGDRKVVLNCDNENDLIKWVCAIDTVRANFTEQTFLNPMDKHRLLNQAYKLSYKGGEISSSYDEIWSYSPDGVLSSGIGLPIKLTYRWDGEMLIGIDNISRDLGSGKWDGITLIWYDESANGMIATPSVRFDFNQSKGEYTNAVEPSQVWKWTRHFLASKFGAGEWIIEGNVPQPVVMFLQMIRNCRLQKTVENETNIEEKILI